MGFEFNLELSWKWDHKGLNKIVLIMISSRPGLLYSLQFRPVSCKLAAVVGFCFFIYQYGLVYQLNITKQTKSIMVYGLSWLVIFVILFVLKTVSIGRRKFSADFQLAFRLIKGMIFVTFISILVILFVLQHMTVQDIILCIMGFMSTGWDCTSFEARYSQVDGAVAGATIAVRTRNFKYVMGVYALLATVSVAADYTRAV